MKDILELRNEIDSIDKEIVALYEKRVKASEAVARYKINTGKPVLDTNREAQKIREIKELASTPFNGQSLESIFAHIMAISRMRQYMLMADEMQDTTGFRLIEAAINKQTKVVFQGVKGAYGQQAMEGYFGRGIDSFNVETFQETMEVIKNNRAEYGVLPIENSSTGIITDVYDLLERYENYIVGEYVVKVEHALLGLPDALIDDIKTVYSHPQGLLQCRRFLDEHEQWEQISLQNTAIAAKKVVDDGNKFQAAIASERAAKAYGLKVLKSQINDIDNNSTRFIIIKSKKEYVKEANQVSICFELPHASGSLYNILAHFIFNDINMTKIESRPIRGEKWRYHFFIDFEGNLMDKSVKSALTGISSETKNFRILGNYVRSKDENSNE